MRVAVGIDIGTSNCCVCIARPLAALPSVAQIEVVPSASGAHLTPSMIAVGVDNNVLVGEIAKQQQADNPLRTFYNFKRVLGLPYTSQTLWEKAWSCSLAQSRDQPQTPVFVVADSTGATAREYTAQALYKIMAQHLADLARSRLAPGEIVGAVTVTVPIHFNATQRAQTRDAVRAAFPPEVHCAVLDEPVAAVTAYMQQNRLRLSDLGASDHIMVFDLGGGTLDVTLLRPSSSTPLSSTATVGAQSALADKLHACATAQDGLHVCASSGLSTLGGVDFDAAILKSVQEQYYKQTKRDIKADKTLTARARHAAEDAKIALSLHTSTTLVFDSAAKFAMPITRANFDRWIRPYLQQASKVMYAVLAQIPIEPHKVTDVIVVGGSAQVPAVRAMVAEFFRPHTVRMRNDVNPTESVAYGAAAHAFASLGLYVNDAPPSTPQTTASAANKPTINKSTTNNTQTKIVPALSGAIGIRLPHGVVRQMLARNTRLPCSATLDVYPVRANQSQAVVRVYQGDSDIVTPDTALLATLCIPLRRAADRLRLELAMDTSGLLHMRLFNMLTKCDVTQKLLVS